MMDIFICAAFVNMYVLLLSRRPGIQLLAFFSDEGSKQTGTKNGRRE
jgi:hypothetical protein